MARRSLQQWQKLIDQQAASGQTATAFCASRGIDNKWRHQTHPCPFEQLRNLPDFENIYLNEPILYTVTIFYQNAWLFAGHNNFLESHLCHRQSHQNPYVPNSS